MKLKKKSWPRKWHENETVDKKKSSRISSRRRELFSSGGKVLIRYFSVDGAFPSRAFGARWKVESVQFQHQTGVIQVARGGQGQGHQKGQVGRQIFNNINFPLLAPNNLKEQAEIKATSGFNVRVYLPVTSSNQNCETSFVEVKTSFFFENCL